MHKCAFNFFYFDVIQRSCLSLALSLSNISYFANESEFLFTFFSWLSCKSFFLLYFVTIVQKHRDFFRQNEKREKNDPFSQFFFYSREIKVEKKRKKKKEQRIYRSKLWLYRKQKWHSTTEYRLSFAEEAQHTHTHSHIQAKPQRHRKKRIKSAKA